MSNKYSHSRPDFSEYLESQVNRMFHQAMDLLKLVAEQLDPNGFSVNDIREYINFRGKNHNDPGTPSIIRRYGVAHINFLIGRGLLEEVSARSFAFTDEAWVIIDHHDDWMNFIHGYPREEDSCTLRSVLTTGGGNPSDSVR
jgi:hypothetical protein